MIRASEDFDVHGRFQNQFAMDNGNDYNFISIPGVCALVSKHFTSTHVTSPTVNYHCCLFKTVFKEFKNKNRLEIWLNGRALTQGPEFYLQYHKKNKNKVAYDFNVARSN